MKRESRRSIKVSRKKSIKQCKKLNEQNQTLVDCKH